MGHKRMQRPPLPILLTLVLWLVLVVSGCTQTYSTEVDSAQKISDTSGNFDGNLNITDQFGSAIANIGDLEVDGVTDLAVGAPFDDDNGLNRGAVWILFMDDDGRVDIQQKISDDAGGFGGELDNDDQFGSAVAALGDLNKDGFLDLAVGAPLDDDGGTDRGAVWILFLNGDGTVRLEQKISDDTGGFTGDLDGNDQFGRALASIGDLNNDGVRDLAVGVPNDDDSGTDRGAVWILFMNLDGTVNSAQKISSDEGNLDPNPDNGDHFGSSVAVIGDLNDDGVIDLAVGSTGDDDGGTDRGAVWILFLNSDGTVDSTERISQNRGAFDGQLSDRDQFGSAVANLGDINDDGINDLAVGAKQSDDGEADQGAIWILFMQSNGEVISSSFISDTEGKFGGRLNAGDQFGGAVASIGDLNDDGPGDIAVGASLDDSGGADKGAAWILFMEPTDSNLDRSEGGVFDAFLGPDEVTIGTGDGLL